MVKTIFEILLKQKINGWLFRGGVDYFSKNLSRKKEFQLKSDWKINEKFANYTVNCYWKRTRKIY